jgi:hypothetical protein
VSFVVDGLATLDFSTVDDVLFVVHKLMGLSARECPLVLQVGLPRAASGPRPTV